MIQDQIKERLRLAKTKAMVVALREAAAFIPMPKPTTFIGSGGSLQMCDRIAQLGFRTVLLVSDKDLTKLGLYNAMSERLQSQGVKVAVYDGVLPDPTVDQVLAGLAVCNQHNCEAILAVGGGSVLDAAKLISVAKTNDKPILEMKGYFRVRHAGLPLFVAPTTAGTGSEATIAAVVSDPTTHRKTAIMDLKLVPSMAALDPDLLVGLPRGTTIFTALDTMTHAIETFLSAISSKRSDPYAIAALKMVESNLPLVLQEPGNKAARQELLVAAYYAGIAFTQSNVGFVHAVAHRLGGYYQIPHGKANAIVLPYVLELMVDKHTARMAELARQWGKASASDSEQRAAKAVLDFVARFTADLGIPNKVEQMQAGDIPGIAREALEEAYEVIHYAVPFYLNQQECEALVRRLLP